MSYTTQKIVIALVFAVYIFSCLVFEYYLDRIQIYPVFSWSLFSNIPNPKAKVTIRLHELHGIQYDPPLTFQDINFLFEKIGHSPTQYTLVLRRLGHALVNGSQNEVAKERAFLEAVFDGGTFRYDIVRITYDPLTFFRTRKVETVEYIASFSDSL